MRIFALVFLYTLTAMAQGQSQSTEVSTKIEPQKEWTSPQSSAPKSINNSRPNRQQVSTPIIEKQESSKELERIVITGSYIRKTVKEGSPSPVTRVDQNNMKQTGNYTFAETLNESAIASTSQFGSAVSFHGQGAGNNLILLNGLRLPKTAGGDNVDIDFIPSSAIERVEILKDGASALYGSEALSGVINIITKQDPNESSLMLRHSNPQVGVGADTNIVGTFGKKFSRGSFLAVAQFRGSQHVDFSDTQYGMLDVQSRGSESSNFANFFKGRSSFRAADCPTDRVKRNGLCGYNYYDTQVFQPEKKFYNLLMSGDYNAGNKIRMEAVALYTRRDWTMRSSPMYWQMEDLRGAGGPDFSIKPSAVKNWDTNFVNKLKNSKGQFSKATDFGANENLTLRYSADEELGRRVSNRKVDNIVTQFKIGQLRKDWDWEFSTGYGLTFFKDTLEQGNARRDVILDLINKGQFNPLKAQGQKDDLSEAMIETWYRHTSDVINTKAVTTGKILDTTRPVYAAFGLEGQRQSFRFENDELSKIGIPLTGLASDQQGDRTVGSAFLELSNSPIKNLEIQLAGRFDQYSDFGSTVNPKIGATYDLSKKTNIRSSYGTGFKAPGLLAVYQGDLTNVRRVRDEVACSKNDPNNCNNLYSVTSFGDQDLRPELGEHFNLGFETRPNKKWTFAIDHWRAQGTNALNQINLNALTQAELLYGKAFVENATGVTINRVNGVIQNIRVPVQVNSGKYWVNGIDLGAQFRTLIRGGYNFIFRTDHSHTLSSSRQDFFFTPILGARDLQWKNVSSVALAKGNHLAKWRVRTYASQDKDQGFRGAGKGSIPTYSEHDLHYEYYAAWNGVVTLGVKNIFDQTLTNDLNRGQSGFALPASVTSLGRTFYMSYEHTF